MPNDHSGKPVVIFSAICRRDVTGVLNMFETCCNFSAAKIAASCRDKNRLCKQAFMRSPLGPEKSVHLTEGYL